MNTNIQLTPHQKRQIQNRIQQYVDRNPLPPRKSRVRLDSHERSSLQNRIERFLNCQSCLPINIPVHPRDLNKTLMLREKGFIPNLPIKVLGGKFYSEIKLNNGGSK